MRMPRLRFTVPGLMILVAVVGIGLRVVYLRRYDSDEAAIYRRLAGNWHVSINALYSENRGAGMARHVAEMTEYYEVLALKYERAALYPWLPFQPDPPEPAR